MYSVINVDISPRSLIPYSVDYGDGLLRAVQYDQQAIIRGSSTVNEDSAHSNETLSQKHNYVSFYVKSIKVRYDISYEFLPPLGVVNTGYVILFKLPYKNDGDIRYKLIYQRVDSMILYSHPECVLAYDVYNFGLKQRAGYPSKLLSEPRYLNCNKPFVVGPNDYVGIFYYFPYSAQQCVVSSTAKVTFKPQ